MWLFSVLRCRDDLLTNPGSAIISERLFLFNFPVLLLIADGSANCSRGSEKASAEGCYMKDHALALSVDPASVCSAVHSLLAGDH